jgi:hypothetical protein
MERKIMLSGKFLTVKEYLFEVFLDSLQDGEITIETNEYQDLHQSYIQDKFREKYNVEETYKMCGIDVDTELINQTLIITIEEDFTYLGENYKELSICYNEEKDLICAYGIEGDMYNIYVFERDNIGIIEELRLEKLIEKIKIKKYYLFFDTERVDELMVDYTSEGKSFDQFLKEVPMFNYEVEYTDDIEHEIHQEITEKDYWDCERCGNTELFWDTHKNHLIDESREWLKNYKK